MSLFNLSAEYEAMQRRAREADAEYAQLLDLICGHFLHGDPGATEFLQVLAEDRRPYYTPPLRELKEGPL